MESRKRSITKAVVWNIIGFGMMLITGFLATGSWTTGGGVALINTTIGFISYFLYERFWARVRWGTPG